MRRAQRSCRHARRHSAPQNSPASPLRHTAASVQITVAPSILHPNNGGDPDDPSHITPFGEGKCPQSVWDQLWAVAAHCCEPPSSASSGVRQSFLQKGRGWMARPA